MLIVNWPGLGRRFFFFFFFLVGGGAIPRLDDSEASRALMQQCKHQTEHATWMGGLSNSMPTVTNQAVTSTSAACSVQRVASCVHTD